MKFLAKIALLAIFSVTLTACDMQSISENILPKLTNLDATPTPAVTPKPSTPTPTSTPKPATPSPSPLPPITPTASPIPATPTPTVVPTATPVSTYSCAGANYFLAPKTASPAGNDSTGDGSAAKPFFSLERVWKVIKAGDLVCLRGGTYAFGNQQFLTTYWNANANGTSAMMIKIWAYPGETPVLTRAATWTKEDSNADGVSRWYRGGIYFSGNFFHWRGMEIKGFYQTDQNIESGFLIRDANDNTFEGFNVHDNCHGAYLEGNSSRNLFLNGDFYRNYDPLSHNGDNEGGSADGLGLAYTTGSNNIIRGCRAWDNSDDGFDTFEHQGYVLIENSWSWHNGYKPGTNTTTKGGNGVGFKLGSVFLSGDKFRTTLLRTVRNVIAFDNLDWGIHQNEGVFQVEMYNNTLYKNKIGGPHFHYENLAHKFVNNISFGNIEHQIAISPNSTSTTNACDLNDPEDATPGWIKSVTSADFVSLDGTQLARPRKADGSLPDIDFLKLKQGSKLINKGTPVTGIPYRGSAPDLGAFESSY